MNTALLMSFLFNVAKKGFVPCLFIVIAVAGYAQNITRPNIQGPSGLQVNSYTGNLYYQRQDFLLPGRGLSMDLSFFYNSNHRGKNVGFGNGWNFNYNLYYIKDSVGSILIYRADGQSDFYQLKNGKLTRPAGVFDELQEHAPNKYVLTTKEKTKYFFDDAGHRKLTKIVDRNGNEILCNYSGNLLISLVDGSNRKALLTWSSDNWLSELKLEANNNSRTISYSYDEIGGLIAVYNPIGVIINYNYGPNRAMSSLTDGNGNQSSIYYNSRQAVIKINSCHSEKSIQYNTAQSKTYETEKGEGKSIVTVYEFDKQGKLINKTGNCCGFNTTYAYDQNNNITSFTDANGNSTLYAYDSHGNLLAETDPLGNSDTYSYDTVLNKMLTHTDKKGNITTYSYDTKGNLLQVKNAMNVSVFFTYDAKGNVLTYKDGRNAITNFGYDQYNSLATITDPYSKLSQLSNDEWGNMVSYTDANNHQTSFSYDNVNRLLSYTDAMNGLYKYTYDANGNILSFTNPKNNTTTFLYNSLDKIIQVKDALNNLTSYAYDFKGNITKATNAKGYATKYLYDHLSRLISIVNPLNEETSCSYDGNGNRISIQYPNGNLYNIKYDDLDRVTEVADKLGIVAKYKYDAVSKLETETNAKGHTTSFGYDVLYRLTRLTDPLGNSYLLEYDDNGNMVKKTDRNGNSTNYTYDLLNRQLTMQDALNYVTAFSYDDVGNLKTITDARQNTTSYLYNALNRQVQEKLADNSERNYMYDANGNLQSFTDPKNQTINYSYDKIDRLLAKTYPGGVDSFAYDVLGLLIRAKNSNATNIFTYDAINRLLSESSNDRITGYEYSTAARTKTLIYPSGRRIVRQSDEREQLIVIRENNLPLLELTYDGGGVLTGKKYKNGIQTNYTYNANGRLSEINNTPAAIADFRLTYDKEDNPLMSQFLHKQVSSENYLYDKKDQLIGFNKGGVNTSFSYDQVGNRTSFLKNGSQTTYAVNNINAYTSVHDTSLKIYSYDRNGNLTSDGVNTFSYDHDNRIVAVNNNYAVKYDAMNRRIQKSNSSVATTFYYIGSQVIEEQDEQNLTEAEYIWGGRLDDIVSMQRDGKNYFYHSNHIGSIAAVTDSSGGISERYEYSPFGIPEFYDKNLSQRNNSAINNPYLFTAREYDNETNLYYYRYRDYSQHLGRFMQQDPMGYVDGMSMYSYVRNRPTVMLDPFGLSASYCSNRNPPNNNPCNYQDGQILTMAGMATGAAGGMVIGVGVKSLFWWVPVLAQIEMTTITLATLASPAAIIVVGVGIAAYAGYLLYQASKCKPAQNNSNGGRLSIYGGTGRG